MIKFLFSLALSLFLLSFSPMVNSAGWTCSGGYSSPSEACGTFHDYSVFSEFQKKISTTYHYSCKYYGGQDRDTPYQYKNVTCGGTCPTETYFNEESGSCDDEPPPPPIDCNDTETVHQQDFFFEGISLDQEPNSLDHCSGPGGKGGCHMKEAGLAVCTGGGNGSGVTCFGDFKSSGRCSQGTSTEANPHTGIPEGDKLAVVTSELEGSQIITDDFKFDSSKMGNCGTFNGEQKCFPLAESNQSDSNNGKDLLVKEKGDTEGTEGLDKVGKVKDTDGKEYDIYDASIGDDAPIQGGFDSGGSSGNNLSAPEDSPSGATLEWSDGSGSAGIGELAKQLEGTEQEQWGEDPDGIDTNFLQKEFDKAQEDIQQEGDKLAEQNQQKYQNLQESGKSALLDYVLPEFNYSGDCTIATIPFTLGKTTKSFELSFCAFLDVFQLIGAALFFYVNIRAVILFIAVATKTDT